MSKVIEQIDIIGETLAALPKLRRQHARETPTYEFIETLVRQHMTSEHSSQDPSFAFGPFGLIHFPYHRMGAISTLDLFGLDEMILFAFYLANQNRYHHVIDIGANLGLHSILFGKLGWSVQAYEPDPTHFELLGKNILENTLSNVSINRAAVSTKAGTAEFVRVLGNTTSSHLLGDKESYGDLETYEVDVVDIKQIVEHADLLKIDAEGHEGKIICEIPMQRWQDLDAVVEVGSSEVANEIFTYSEKANLCCFAQKLGWERVTEAHEMPTSYKEGSLFITSKNQMSWG